METWTWWQLGLAGMVVGGLIGGSIGMIFTCFFIHSGRRDKQLSEILEKLIDAKSADALQKIERAEDRIPPGAATPHGNVDRAEIHAQ